MKSSEIKEGIIMKDDEKFEEKLEDNEAISSIMGSSVEGSQYLTFGIDEEEYAISILKVKEIIEMKKITKIPNLPEYIKGIINLRGNIIHVVDIREKFGMEAKEYDKFNVIIIVEAADRVLGIIVDQVKDVLSIDKAEIQPPIDFEGTIDNIYIEGMSKVGDRLVVVVDIDKMLAN